MLVPKQDHYGIAVRNFFAIFVCISLMTYIHFELNEATSTLEDANAIVRSMLKNETYTTIQQRLFNLKQALNDKSYHELSQAECLTRIYLDVLNNNKFVSSSEENSNIYDQSSSQKVQLPFSELIFPTVDHGLEGFRNCSDILTLMNFLNPTQTDFIYTKFMQEKYGSFIQNLKQEQATKTSKNLSKFCILTNQFNTSTTKLRENVNSVIDQSYQNYRLIILDNGSTDGSYEIAKVILSDLKDKLTSENPTKVNDIQQKYQILKEDSKLGLWELYKKHESGCEGMDFVAFVDGRDSFPNRFTLSILNHHIQSATQKPAFLTASMLKRKELSLQVPADLTTSNKILTLPTYTFKIASTELLNKTKEKLYEMTLNATHSFEVEKATVETFFNYCQENKKPIMQIDEMMYVYDTIENKEIQRNQYFVAVVKKELSKGKKEQKKEEKKL